MIAGNFLGQWRLTRIDMEQYPRISSSITHLPQYESDVARIPHHAGLATHGIHRDKHGLRPDHFRECFDINAILFDRELFNRYSFLLQ